MRWAAPIVIVAAAASACAAKPTREGRVTLAERALAVSLVPARAEVWAWTIDLEGESEDGAPLAACEVAGVRAEIDGARWRARVPLTAGDNTIAAACRSVDGRSALSPAAHAMAELRDAPTAALDVSVDDATLRLDGTRSHPSGAVGGAPLASWSWSIDGSRIASERGPRASSAVPRADGAHVVALAVHDTRGGRDEARALVLVKHGRARVAQHAPIGEAPWADEAIVYGVVPPLFGSPPLAATTRALPSLVDLGVTTIWLSPVFDSPRGDYGYAVTDYFRIRSDYGTAADLRSLVAEAHFLGLRVLLDLPLNDTSDQHRYFRDAEALGRASHTFAFYERDASGAPTHYFDWSGLPNLRYDAESTTWLTEVATRWIRAAEVDGFRLDAAWGPAARSRSFWNAWVGEVRRVAPEALLIAEATARDPYWLNHGFDAAYDWTNELGHAAWEHAFDDGDAIVARLDAALAPLAGTAEGARVLRFLDDNDTGARFITRHGPDVTRVAAALLFTLPGMPCLFTGDERGAEFEPYQQHEPLTATDRYALRPWFARLAALRRQTPALRGASYQRVSVRDATPSSDASRMMAYARGDLIVVLAFAPEPTSITLRAPRSDARRWRDLLGGASLVSRDGALRISLPAWGVRVLAPSD